MQPLPHALNLQAQPRSPPRRQFPLATPQTTFLQQGGARARPPAAAPPPLLAPSRKTTCCLAPPGLRWGAPGVAPTCVPLGAACGRRSVACCVHPCSWSCWPSASASTDPMIPGSAGLHAGPSSSFKWLHDPWLLCLLPPSSTSQVQSSRHVLAARQFTGRQHCNLTGQPGRPVFLPPDACFMNTCTSFAQEGPAGKSLLVSAAI